MNANYVPIVVIALTLFSCNLKNDSTAKESANTIKDTADHGYDELANPKGQKSFEVSDYNTHNPDAAIDRPAKSTITTTLDTALLLNTWTANPDGPHADFVISKKSFYIVDYEGDGNMPYILNGYNLKIYYNDFVQHGEITAVTRDTLKIRWQDADEAVYVLWKDN